MAFKLPDFNDRKAAANASRQAVLDKFKAKAEPTPEELAERAARAAAQETKKIEKAQALKDRIAAEKAAVIAAREAKEAAARKAAEDALITEEMKAAAKKAERDAKYAARKIAKKAAKR